MPDDRKIPDIDRETLWREMDVLAQRIGTRLLEFRNRNEFAQPRGQLTRLAERHRQLRNRFETAQGPEWDSGKHELARIHGDLFDEFVKFEEKLDRNERMRPPPGRDPGGTAGLV